MQIPLANIHWCFLLVRDDWGFQVNPLCRHDITSPFPPSGNEGYVRNRDVSLSLAVPFALVFAPIIVFFFLAPFSFLSCSVFHEFIKQQW